MLNAYLFEYGAKELCSEYNAKSHLNRNEQQCKNLIDDIVVTVLHIRQKIGLFNFDPISKIKLKGNYSRKLVVQVFSKLDLKVTRYIRKYGRTIVHFEDTSDSSQ